MLLILGAARRAAEGMKRAREKNWNWAADFLIGKQLTGSRLGILGMGRIGRAVAKIAKSFQKVPKAWRSMDIRPNGLWSWNYILYICKEHLQ